MTRMNKQDEIRLARYLDGEMPTAERAEFDTRLQRDPILRAALDSAEEPSRALRDARQEPLRAAANFSATVLDRVRRMPSRDELVQLTATEENIAAFITYGRRLLVAAVVLFGLGLLFGFNLVRNDHGPELQAIGDKKLMKELDTKVKQILRERALK
jgi:anti-sigma factor RsiW